MISRLQRRSYSAGHFLFRLDHGSDEGAAYLKSVGGGMVKGAVLEEQAGPASQQFKHIGAVEIDPITIEIGMALSRPVLDWIKGSWEKKFTRQDGCIVHADFNLKCKMEQWFYRALITETKFPTLDGAAKDPAYLSVTIHPEEVEHVDGDDTAVTGFYGQNQKLWLPSNFRMWIQGIDCTYVNRIDSFTVTQKVKPLYLGQQRFPELEPTGIDFSNITVYIAAEHATDFEDWYQETVIAGTQETTAERPGYIEFLGPDNDTVLFTINLNELGIHRMSLEKSEANAEQIKRYKIELYMETMELEWEDKYLR
jgi:hypothetical protein